eukprot:13317792-Alexandrium_andersonii.AAC.1
MQNRFTRLKLELRGPRKRPRIPPQRVLPGEFGVILRAEADGDDETCWRARWRRFSAGSGGAETPRDGAKP